MIFSFWCAHPWPRRWATAQCIWSHSPTACLSKRTLLSIMVLRQRVSCNPFFLPSCCCADLFFLIPFCILFSCFSCPRASMRVHSYWISGMDWTRARAHTHTQSHGRRPSCPCSALPSRWDADCWQWRWPLRWGLAALQQTDFCSLNLLLLT